ncbi:7-cyano-7-deazaguanine synthase [Maribellus sp. CM-23]|uniref:Qat anti-phage system QueC-like protein QatC n=1 Tax=Maribellus sp. CM-23 TaxID=2781026 RepID=UPI001F26888B|nr:Qat anti-phage system QueC-like protein QatC [Maribellus sp. CM-23]MCE4564350.1 7-cyano-7-deazaguanine synthase [Maribellus sp. CM-23]
MNHIVCKLNTDDKFSISEQNIEIDLTNKDYYHLSFFNKARRLYQFPTFFKKEALDLFYISLIVFFADRKIIRSKSADAWTREITLHIPVLELNKWQENKTRLEEMVSFLSGDIWKFEFREREENETEMKFSAGMEKSKKNFIPDFFCMLSGGLDSYIGAIDLLQESKNIAFISHYGGGKGVKPYQDLVISNLIKEYSLPKELFFTFNAVPIKTKEEIENKISLEDSTRTRSLMFFAHAILLASATDKPIDLYIPENGLISLNIPLTNTRLGSNSTRTTHPYYMSMLQNLMNNLGIAVTLKNPFQFFTKGEMIKNCKNPNFLKGTLANTMSCSHPDNDWKLRKETPSHCGYCLPCVIRRAAIEFAFENDNSYYRIPNFDKGNQAPKELQSYKIGILDYKNNMTNVSFKIQASGPIQNKFNEFEELYKRGMNELMKLLDKYNG